MRVRVESGFIYQGRALADGDEIDLPDPLAEMKLRSGQVSQPTPVPPPEERSVEKSVDRDPKPNTRDPRPPRTR